MQGKTLQALANEAPPMPHNEEIEQILLGCLLVDDKVYDDVAHLRPEHFYLAVHGRIYDLIRRAREAGRSITPNQIAQYFAKDEDLTDAGGTEYIQDLARHVISTVNARAHADHIYELHLRRVLKDLSGRLAALADNPDAATSPKELLAQSEKLIYEASETGADDTTLHISACTRKTIEALKNPQAGIGTGIPKLDAMLRGLKPGELYIIAGRPGMGKTAMGLTLALNIAIAGRKTLFNSLEMPQEQLTQRLLSRLSGECVHSGEPYDADKVDEARRKLDPLHLHVDDRAGLTVSDIITRARRHKRRRGLDALFIDYLGLIVSEDKRANKVHQVEEITTALKRLSKDLKIPVVLLCQLNRALEHRDNKRPTLADLRDSGAIEQDADVVMFIYRQEHYAIHQDGEGQSSQPPGRIKSKNAEAAQLADLEALKGKAEVIIAKNRQNRTGTVHLCFDAERQLFHDND